VLLTCNRRHFRRLDAQIQQVGGRHSGIALLPKSFSVERMIVRAAMLLDWLAMAGPDPTALVNWNDLQLALHRGERVHGYDENEVEIALGMRSG
jgi:hypothetical protein